MPTKKPLDYAAVEAAERALARTMRIYLNDRGWKAGTKWCTEPGSTFQLSLADGVYYARKEEKK